MKKFNFITFEGIEGCGKSTQVKNLQKFFTERKIEAIFTREPGGVEVSEEIRNILLSQKNINISSETELLLNYAARKEHIEQLIKPALNSGKKVVCDRFFDSTTTYQGYAMGINLAHIAKIQEIVIGDFEPDITFLIDLPVNMAFERIKNRSTNNRYEQMDFEFHQKVRDGYLEIAKNNSRFVVIDGLANQSDIFAKILEILDL